MVEPWEHYSILRRRAGMPLWRLAELLGITKEYISRMERGEKPWTHLIAFWEGKTIEAETRIR